ncbi:MAG: prolyl oligopeptidase family serine peptidase [Burkholderiales bacterium]|nr:prolyl oligopeptidase family serine peptidase [Nitrosomonas sp.]MCP5275661.1 prolyl oligopeptidase family serine peptidase [Burkholderiales bacterium]
MQTLNQFIYTLRLFILSIICVPLSVEATALLSDELEFYLPWVTYQGKSYSAHLTSENSNELIFQLSGINPLVASAPQGGAASVDDNLNISVPLVSFRGELYSATLNHIGNGGFKVANATPFVVPEVRGAVVSAALIETKTADQITIEYPIATIAGLDLRFNVAVYRIGYRTLDAFGNLTEASGVIGVPLGIPAGAPLLSFQHGTITSRARAPSVDPEETGADLALYLMGARGYVVMVPDYLGFGDSSGLHPFMHAKTLAWTVIDLIRAVKLLAKNGGYPLNGQLFLAGYSEGGYATMAAQREIETHHADEFTITASAPMAGAYDLSGTMLQQVLSGDPLPRPMYFPYLLLAYNQIYRINYAVHNLLAGGFDTALLEVFDGSQDSDAINDSLPNLPSELFSANLLAALESDLFHPLRAALENNDVYRWTPVSPTRLYHCLDDDRVPYENSIVAMEYFTATGADVELETLLSGNHIDCAVPALLNGSAWFDTLVRLP